MSEIVFRPLAEGDDLELLLDLTKAFFHEYAAHDPAFFAIGELRDEDLVGRFVDSITNDKSCTILAFNGQTLVGYCSVVVRDQSRFWAVPRVGAIQGLYVAPAFRRRGIASELLRAAKTWFREREIHYYTVYTACANDAAIAAYRSAGMAPLQTVFLGEVQ